MDGVNISFESLLSAGLTILFLAALYNLFPQRGGVYEGRSNGIGAGVLLFLGVVIGLVAYMILSGPEAEDLSLDVNKMEILPKVQKEDSFDYRNGGDLFISPNAKGPPTGLLQNEEMAIPEYRKVVDKVNLAPTHNDVQSIDEIPNATPAIADEYYVQRAAATNYQRAIARKEKEEELFPGQVYVAKVEGDVALKYKIIIGPFRSRAIAKQFVNDPKAYIRNRHKDKLILFLDPREEIGSVIIERVGKLL